MTTQFSADGNVVYTINAVNVVKATESGDARRINADGGRPSPTRSTRRPASSAREPAGVTYNTASSIVQRSRYNGSQVTYTVAGTDR